MGYEFIANVRPSGPSLEKIADHLCLTNRYLMEELSGTKALLRFSDKDRRSDWPEDFTLSREGNTFLLTIHSATTKELEQIVRDVESALNAFGVSVSFEEI